MLRSCAQIKMAWSKVWDEDSQTHYFWDETTDETSWEQPADYEEQNNTNTHSNEHKETNDASSPIAGNQKKKFLAALEGFGPPPIYIPIPSQHPQNSSLEDPPNDNIKYFKCHVIIK